MPNAPTRRRSALARATSPPAFASIRDEADPRHASGPLGRGSGRPAQAQPRSRALHQRSRPAARGGWKLAGSASARRRESSTCADGSASRRGGRDRRAAVAPELPGRDRSAGSWLGRLETRTLRSNDRQVTASGLSAAAPLEHDDRRADRAAPGCPRAARSGGIRRAGTGSGDVRSPPTRRRRVRTARRAQRGVRQPARDPAADLVGAERHGDPRRLGVQVCSRSRLAPPPSAALNEPLHRVGVVVIRRAIDHESKPAVCRCCSALTAIRPWY